MIKFNPVTKNGLFEVCFASTETHARKYRAVDASEAKWKFLKFMFGKKMNGDIYNDYASLLKVKTLQATERLYK